jgi:hypothetical protein
MNVRTVGCAWIFAVTLVACGHGADPDVAGGPAGSLGTGSRPGEDRATSSSTAAALPPATPAPASTTTATPGADNSALVAYAFEEDIWLYDGRSGQVERLTSDRYQRTDHSPQFRDRHSLTFVSMGANKDDSTLVEVNLDSGSRRSLVHVDNALWAYDWSGDGSTLAYVTSVPGDQSDSDGFAHELRRVAPDGAVTVLRRFPGLFGRGGYANYDEVHVEWSRDGSRLLVVDTHLDGLHAEPRTLFLLDADGTDVVEPRAGTWGRWAAESATVVYVDGQGDVQWLDVATGSAIRLPVPGPARRLAISPQGRFLAYDDGDDDPAVHLYDLEGRTGRRVARHAVGALWLSPETLAAGHATPCVPSDVIGCDAGGHGTPWSEAGDGWRIDVTTGTVAPLPVASTLDAAVAPTTG